MLIKFFRLDWENYGETESYEFRMLASVNNTSCAQRAAFPTFANNLANTFNSQLFLAYELIQLYLQTIDLELREVSNVFRLCSSTRVIELKSQSKVHSDDYKILLGKLLSAERRVIVVITIAKAAKENCFASSISSDATMAEAVKDKR